MKDSEFPLEKTNSRLPEFNSQTEPRHAVYRYLESPSAEVASSPGYDSLRDYWHILFRHRKTLLYCTLAGLLGATGISLLQTPTYRVRTSLEIQSTNMQDLKNPTDSAGSYTTPESYVETQVKLLQSESLLEDVVDKLKLHKERPTGWRALTSAVQRMVASFIKSHPP